METLGAFIPNIKLNYLHSCKKHENYIEKPLAELVGWLYQARMSLWASVKTLISEQEHPMPRRRSGETCLIWASDQGLCECHRVRLRRP